MPETYQLLTTDNATETELVQNMLSKNGIESFAQTDATSEGLEALEGSSPFGSHIYVAADKYEKAKELVAAYFGNEEHPGVRLPNENANQ